MLDERVTSKTPELKEEGVRVRFIGRRKGVAAELVERMARAEDETAANDRITLFVALNETIVKRPISTHYEEMLALVGLIDSNARAWVEEISRVNEVLSARP